MAVDKTLTGSPVSKNKKQSNESGKKKNFCRNKSKKEREIRDKTREAESELTFLGKSALSSATLLHQ